MRLSPWLLGRRAAWIGAVGLNFHDVRESSDAEDDGDQNRDQIPMAIGYY